MPFRTTCLSDHEYSWSIKSNAIPVAVKISLYRNIAHISVERHVEYVGSLTCDYYNCMFMKGQMKLSLYEIGCITIYDIQQLDELFSLIVCRNTVTLPLHVRHGIYLVSSTRVVTTDQAPIRRLYCIVLYCIVLYCIVLYCIVLYCVVLCCVALRCVVLCGVASHRIASYIYCIVL